MAKFPKYLCYRADLHADGLDSEGHMKCTLSLVEVKNMLMFDGVDMPTCCRECPVREEHYSTVCDHIRCRVAPVYEAWVEDPDMRPEWCPAQAVEPVECIIGGSKNPSGSELATLLTNSQKFGRIGGEENNGRCDNG